MIHVFPLNDSKKHSTNEFECACECRPNVDWVTRIVTHNSFDGRELIKEANELKNKGNLMN